MSTPIIIGNHCLVRIPNYIDYNVEERLIRRTRLAMNDRINNRFRGLESFEVSMMYDQVVEEEQAQRVKDLEKELEYARSVTTP